MTAHSIPKVGAFKRALDSTGKSISRLKAPTVGTLYIRPEPTDSVLSLYAGQYAR